MTETLHTSGSRNAVLGPLRRRAQLPAGAAAVAMRWTAEIDEA
jgi:hypothetical protein